jgi:hypothetical protein
MLTCQAGYRPTSSIATSCNGPYMVASAGSFAIVVVRKMRRVAYV